MKFKLFGKKRHISGSQFWVGFWLLVYGGLALAQVNNEALPWEGPLCGLANGFKGPTALAVATIAFFCAGASFLWGEELTGMAKKLVTIFMAVSTILGGTALVGWIAVKMGALASQCSS